MEEALALLKKKRQMAKGQFTRAETALKRALDDADSIIPTIEKRYDALEKRWLAMQDAHDLYVTDLEEEDTENEETYIQDLVGRFDAIQVKTDKIIANLAGSMPIIQPEKQKTAMTTDNTEIETTAQVVELVPKGLENVQTAARTTTSNVQYTNAIFVPQTDVRRRQSELKRSKTGPDDPWFEPAATTVTAPPRQADDRHRQQGFQSQEIEAGNAHYDSFAMNMNTEADVRYRHTDKHVMTSGVLGDVVQRVSQNQQESGGNRLERIQHRDAQPRGITSDLQLKRLDLDKFTGDLMKYPAFKERFHKYLMPKCPVFQRPFLLRSHLDEKVREEVDNVEDDMEELWKRLDAKYGNHSKYVDLVLDAIAKAPKGDGKSTLLLINTIEKAHRDLTRIGAAEEMSNSTIIAMVEKKLPEEIRMDWIKTVAPKSEERSGDKFNRLMVFLKGWRQILEYDDSAIRRVPEKKVGSSHMTGATKMKKSDSCWIHEESAAHPIWKCRVFQEMSLEEKHALVIKMKACQACLEKECSGAKKPEDCTKRFKCQVEGCSKAHNTLLHG